MPSVAAQRGSFVRAMRRPAIWSSANGTSTSPSRFAWSATSRMSSSRCAMMNARVASLIRGAMSSSRIALSLPIQRIVATRRPQLPAVTAGIWLDGYCRLKSCRRHCIRKVTYGMPEGRWVAAFWCDTYGTPYEGAVRGGNYADAVMRRTAGGRSINAEITGIRSRHLLKMGRTVDSASSPNG